MNQFITRYISLATTGEIPNTVDAKVTVWIISTCAAHELINYCNLRDTWIVTSLVWNYLGVTKEMMNKQDVEFAKELLRPETARF